MNKVKSSTTEGMIIDQYCRADLLKRHAESVCRKHKKIIESKVDAKNPSLQTGHFNITFSETARSAINMEKMAADPRLVKAMGGDINWQEQFREETKAKSYKVAMRTPKSREELVAEIKAIALEATVDQVVDLAMLLVHAK